MVQVKIIHSRVSSPAEMETLVNKELEKLQLNNYKIMSVNIVNGEAIITYEELNSKKKKILNEKA